MIGRQCWWARPASSCGVTGGAGRCWQWRSRRTTPPRPSPVRQPRRLRPWPCRQQTPLRPWPCRQPRPPGPVPCRPRTSRRPGAWRRLRRSSPNALAAAETAAPWAAPSVKSVWASAEIVFPCAPGVPTGDAAIAKAADRPRTATDRKAARIVFMRRHLESWRPATPWGRRCPTLGTTRTRGR